MKNIKKEMAILKVMFAIIIFIFVIAIGYKAIQNCNEIQEIKAEINNLIEFKDSIEKNGIGLQ